MVRTYKDTFFRFYFSDKTRLLSLCNALTGEDATAPEEIEIATLDKTFFSAMIYVLCNGQYPSAEFRELKLSDAFIEPTESLELKVRVYNLNAPHNRELLMKSLPLEDYCVFVDKFRENKRRGLNDKECFYEAYKYCVRTRVHMAEFLTGHEWELWEMIITEYNAEWDKAAQWEGGRAEGKAEAILDMVKNLLKVKTPIEYIVKASGWSESEILKLAESNG